METMRAAVMRDRRLVVAEVPIPHQNGASAKTTENPGVGGSIPSLPTSILAPLHDTGSMITTPLCPGLYPRRAASFTAASRSIASSTIA